MWLIVLWLYMEGEPIIQSFKAFSLDEILLGRCSDGSIVRRQPIDRVRPPPFAFPGDIDIRF